ncbi:hypothetical protein [Caulobacter sp. 17J65-9]|uniref:hypothetical protein n=1 Tax=Caulobacter sp. 17J65-9 TaxID=2709382 RepID=UPI0013CD9B4E|nr:hypothetical protein [Caulobacter sp. 17J65-9]NEX91486.1 hypothetical protein [Caulobacter sp. 17J65-9]
MGIAKYSAAFAMLAALATGGAVQAAEPAAFGELHIITTDQAARTLPELGGEVEVQIELAGTNWWRTLVWRHNGEEASFTVRGRSRIDRRIAIYVTPGGDLGMIEEGERPWAVDAATLKPIPSRRADPALWTYLGAFGWTAEFAEVSSGSVFAFIAPDEEAECLGTSGPGARARPQAAHACKPLVF